MGLGKSLAIARPASGPPRRSGSTGSCYKPSDRTKCDLYSDLLPLINGRQTKLLDGPRLVGQLVGLERRTARGGRDSIDHAPGAHDDVANAVAGALVTAAGARRNFGISVVPLRGAYG